MVPSPALAKVLIHHLDIFHSFSRQLWQFFAGAVE
jgi:hypothetical protein